MDGAAGGYADWMSSLEPLADLLMASLTPKDDAVQHYPMHYTLWNQRCVIVGKGVGGRGRGGGAGSQCYQMQIAYPQEP